MNWLIFDVIGPVMIGPSSSHTAGASRIGYMGYLLNKGIVKKAKITMYGSFAKVYQGHGSDWAIAGGLLGMQSDDINLVRANEIAIEKGSEYTFIFDTNTKIEHPNTVKVEIFDNNHLLEYVAISVGGGSIVVDSINDVDVDDLDCRESKVLYIGKGNEDLLRVNKELTMKYGNCTADKEKSNFVLQSIVGNNQNHENELIYIPKF
jgi:iron-sulfur-dependent L-serine dehydratase beta subunit